jgi:hypothetical protein
MIFVVGSFSNAARSAKNRLAGKRKLAVSRARRR